jgi:methionyl-tRNA formyltransferase
MRIVFLGTGDFAAPSFAALYDSSHEIAALVTQPERTGRGHHTAEISRIKQTALDHGTAVLQPQSVNTPEALDELRGLNADLFIVAAYGQILSADLLRIPPKGTINIHASLLPKYRGASPINYAIWKGESETGVTLIRVEPALDAGPILGIVRTPIGPAETAGELEERLSLLAVPLTRQVVEAIAGGTVKEIPQDPAQVTRAPKLKKSQGQIDWSQTAEQIDCHIRAMQPWPNAFTFVHTAGKPPVRLQVKQIRLIPSAASGRTSGEVLAADKTGFVVQTGSGPVELVTVQPDGKRPMPAADFLRGNPVRPGDRLGAELAN